MESRVFIELSIFKNKVDALGGVDLLKSIQVEILKDPEKGDIVQGTGGVRKIRVGRAKSGKSGGYRVFYLDLSDRGQTYLMTILDKRDSENISDEEKTLLRVFAKKIKDKR
ncbi:MAG: hypothetical protein A2Z20_08545 [Bdellovibrionales bacterium RBG_16_40_8]|nr:MAG: hypothetical protein A2Z20_08545 [Bdellovibrionales bacterium RBG_16_40_8]